MDKDVNPVLAAVIIAIFLVPVAFRFWAGGQFAESRVSNFYLQNDAADHLSLQVDNQLIIKPPQGKELRYDLGILGVTELRGNVAYFSNNDVLVRIGKPESSWRSMFSFAEFPYEKLEAARQNLVEGHTGQAGFYRCSVVESRCQSLPGLAASWNYKVFIDTRSDEIYLSSGTDHILRKYDLYGTLLAEKNTGFNFPKRMRQHNGEMYLSDTNNHRVVFIEQENDNFGDMTQDHKTVTSKNNIAKWTLDSIPFNGSWWVLNAGNGMENTKLMRFGQNWEYIETIDLPDDAEPADLIVNSENLLVTDRALGVIYQFDKHGDNFTQVLLPEVSRYFKEMDKKRAYYNNLMNLSNIILLVMFVLGGILGVWFSKR
jgi:hypothetical protein